MNKLILRTRIYFISLIVSLLGSSVSGLAQSWNDTVQPGPTGTSYYVLLHTPTQAGGSGIANGGPWEIRSAGAAYSVRVGTEVINIAEFERAGSDDAAIQANSDAIESYEEELSELRDRVASLEAELRMAVARLASLDVQPPENGRTFRVGIGYGSYAGATNVSVTLSRRGTDSDFSVAKTGEGSNRLVRVSMGVSFNNGRNLSRDIQRTVLNTPSWYLSFPDQTLVDEWLSGILTTAVTNWPSDLK
jgi:hypothetical protein